MLSLLQFEFSYTVSGQYIFNFRNSIELGFGLGDLAVDHNLRFVEVKETDVSFRVDDTRAVKMCQLSI